MLAGGITIHSVFDSAGNRISEYNEATGALIREYVWFNGAPLAVIEGGVTTFIRADHIGRPVFGTNTAGTKVWTAAYLPFGGVRTTTGTPITARFPGQWFQSESGLHQNWMRDYDPTTGRYLQADPLGLVDGASIYGYAGQSPAMNVDPSGQCFGPAAFLLPACIFAAGLLYDYLTDDGCYTLGDFAYSVLSNLPPLRPFRAISRMAPEGPGPSHNGPPPKRYSSEKEALVDMAKGDKRTGMTEADMQAYKDLNKGLSDPFPDKSVRGPEAHPTGLPSSRSPHGHVGPVDHIPIK